VSDVVGAGVRIHLKSQQLVQGSHNKLDESELAFCFLHTSVSVAAERGQKVNQVHKLAKLEAFLEVQHAIASL
jgi:hypothetical protein